jgi:hypothetical protein
MEKKFLVVGIFTIIITISFIGCTEYQNEALKGLNYINNEYCFGLNPPENWEIKEPFSSSIVSFRCPMEDSYTTNIQIFVRPIETNETINITLMGIVEQIYGTQGLNLISYELRKVNEMEGCEVVYTISNVSINEQIITIKEKIICTIKNEQLFSIKYDASLNSYNNYLSIVEESINSLVII